TGRTGGAKLIDTPICAYEDAKGRVTNRNPAKIKERNFIIFVFLICNRTQIKKVREKSTKDELRRRKEELALMFLVSEETAPSNDLGDLRRHHLVPAFVSGSDALEHVT